jgi:hypothetical protein
VKGARPALRVQSKIFSAFLPEIFRGALQKIILQRALLIFNGYLRFWFC